MSRPIRIEIAFLTSPLVAALAATIGNAIHYGRLSFTDFHVLLVFTYGFGLAFGVPAFFAYRRLGWDQLWMYSLGGAAIGLVATYLFLGIPFEVQPSLAYMGSVALQYWEMPMGRAVGAASFWLVSGGFRRSNTASQN